RLSAGSPSGLHVEEAVHVADRLHRSAPAADPAGRAGDKALPAVVARRRRVEGELDRLVRGLERARRIAALVLRVVGDAEEGDVDPELRHGEDVGGQARVDVVDGLAVDEGTGAVRPGEAAEEGAARPTRAVDVVARHGARPVRRQVPNPAALPDALR